MYCMYVNGIYGFPLCKAGKNPGGGGKPVHVNPVWPEVILKFLLLFLDFKFNDLVSGFDSLSVSFWMGKPNFFNIDGGASKIGTVLGIRIKTGI